MPGRGVRVGNGGVGSFGGRLRGPAGEVGLEAPRCLGREHVRNEDRTTSLICVYLLCPFLLMPFADE